VLEIVLGIDNIVFISILAGKLPQNQQHKARQTGLALALITRIMLLCSLAWMVRLTGPIFHIPTFGLQHEPHPVSGRDLILLSGGLFLLYIYFAMAFSVGVESLNIRMRTRRSGHRLELNQPYR
jgi:predicted tellurium resistance membrane protein TerC